MIYFKRVAHGSRKRLKRPKDLCPVLRMGGWENLHYGYGPKGPKSSAEAWEWGLGMVALWIRPKGPKELSPVPRMRGWDWV